MLRFPSPLTSSLVRAATALEISTASMMPSPLASRAAMMGGTGRP